MIDRIRKLAIWQRVLALLTGLLFGFGVGLPLSRGDLSPFVPFALTLGILGLLTTRLLPFRAQPVALRIVMAAYALRIATASLLYYAALALGRGGYITGDDLAYSQLAWGWIQWIQGNAFHPYVPPTWAGEAYLFNPFVYLEAVVYYLFGPRVLVMEFINAGMATATIIVIGHIADRFHNWRSAIAAMALVAFFPSVALWSSLNLKDAVVLLLVSLALLSLPQISQPSIRTLVLGYLVALPLVSLRFYIAMGLTLVMAAAWVSYRGFDFRARIRWGLLAVLATVFTLIVSGSTYTFIDPLRTLVGLQQTRAALSAFARTAYVEPPPVAVVPESGETFIVQPVPFQEGVVRPEGLGSPTAAPAAASPSPRRVVHAGPNTTVVLETPSPSAAGTTVVLETPYPSAAATSAAATAEGSPGHDVVYVRPGDLVVIGPPDSTPRPESQREELALSDLRGVPSARFTNASIPVPESLVVTRTLTYLPVGLSYALFSPFPWDARRALDLAVEPDVLLWYAVVAGAAVTVWRGRRRWREILPLILYVGGFLLVFSLAEGNVGTLYRHRGMVIPFAIVLASPALLSWIDRFRGYSAALAQSS